MPEVMKALPASSQIVFEVGNDGNIRGLLNDEEFVLGGCQKNTPCKRSKFEEHLNTQVSKISSVTEFCKQADEFDSAVF